MVILAWVDIWVKVRIISRVIFKKLFSYNQFSAVAQR
jgi:hypothetical protein